MLNQQWPWLKVTPRTRAKWENIWVIEKIAAVLVDDLCSSLKLTLVWLGYMTPAISLGEEVIPCRGLFFLVFIYFSATHIVTNNNLVITQHRLSMKHPWFPNWLKSWPSSVIINHCWGWRAKTSVQMERRWQHRCPRGSRSQKTG